MANIKKYREVIEILKENNVNNINIGLLTFYIPALYIFEVHSNNNIYNKKVLCKVGETFRSIKIRKNEWQKELRIHANDKNLTLSIISCFSLIYNPKIPIKIGNPLVSDKDVHKELKKRWKQLDKNTYGSNEFFEVDIHDVRNIKMIVAEALSDTFSKYLNDEKTRNLDGGTTENNVSFTRDKRWLPRIYQEYVIKNVVKIFDEHDLALIHQSPRTGKTYEAAWIIKTLTNKLNKPTYTIIVTGKLDVQIEHRQTWQEHKNFKDFIYCEIGQDNIILCWEKENSNPIPRNQQEFKNFCNRTNKNIVLFVSIHDLNGEGHIKEKYNFIKDINFDFSIYDECHFGLTSNSKWEQCLNEIYVIKKLFLSATPYRGILNAKYEDKQIIKFDIDEYLTTKRLYSNEKTEKRATEIQEKEELKEKFPSFHIICPKDINYYCSLVKLLSGDKRSAQYAAYNLLYSILYDSEKSLLGIQTKDIIDNFLCNHIIAATNTIKEAEILAEQCVNLINEHGIKNFIVILANGQSNNKNIKSYKNETFATYKKDMETFADKGIKTITFTCDRFLTGTTIPCWDCFLILKSINSAETYEQETKRIFSIFRGKEHVVVWDFNINAIATVEAYKLGLINDNKDISSLKEIETLKDNEDLAKKLSKLIITKTENEYTEVTINDIMKFIENGTITTGWQKHAKDYAPISNEVEKIFQSIVTNLTPNYRILSSKSQRYNKGTENKIDKPKTKNPKEVDKDNKKTDNEQIIKNTEVAKDIFIRTLLQIKRENNEISANIDAIYTIVKSLYKGSYLNINKFAIEIFSKLMSVNDKSSINTYIKIIFETYIEEDKRENRLRDFWKKYEQIQQN